MFHILLNRPAPPLPELHLSEEKVNEVAAMIRTHVNTFLSVSQDIALGKDSRLFFKVAAYLWLISFVGGFTDFLTLGYIGEFICQLYNPFFKFSSHNTKKKKKSSS